MTDNIVKKLLIMCKIHFFCFAILIFVISSCKITKDFSLTDKIKGNEKINNFDNANITPIGNSSNLHSRKQVISSPRAMPVYSLRSRNLSQFILESENKNFKADFPDYKSRRIKQKVPPPMKKFSISDKNVRLLIIDSRFKTMYGSGMPSIHGKQRNKNNLNPKTYRKVNENYLFVFPKKKTMHKYKVRVKPEEKLDLDFWSNPFYKEKRKAKRALQKLDKRKRKPELELFDPRSNIIQYD